MKRTNLQTKRERNRAIAILGISLALIVVLHALAEGLKAVMTFSLALGMIPVLVVSQWKNWRYGLIVGTFFGIVSLLTAVFRGYAGIPVWGHVINPLVSVLPRALVGLVCALLATLANRVFARIDAKHKQASSIADASAPLEIDAETALFSEAERPVREDNADISDAERSTDAPETASLDAESIAIDQPEPDLYAAQYVAETNKHETLTAPATNAKGIRVKRVGRVSIEYIVYAVITLIGVLLNAVGFLGMLLLFARGETIAANNVQYQFDLVYVLEFVVGINTLIEAIVFTVISPAIILALNKSKLFRS